MAPEFNFLSVSTKIKLICHVTVDFLNQVITLVHLIHIIQVNTLMMMQLSLLV